MQFRFYVFALFSLLGYQYATADETYPSVVNNDPDIHAEWYQVCMGVKDVQQPPADKPAAAEMQQLKDCDPDVLYRQTDEKPAAAADWAAVRKCAFAAHSNYTLAMLYANGRGVKQNDKLAMRYVCSSGGFESEIASQVLFLSQPHPEEDLDTCDFAGYTLSFSACHGIDDRLHTAVRNQKIASQTANFSPLQQTRFHSLQISASNLAEVRAFNEIDGLGSGRTIDMIDAERKEQDAFASLVEALEHGKLIPYQNAQVMQLDAEMNRLYKRAMNLTDEQLQDVSVKRPGIRRTQRSWLKYRDAWTAFLAARQPGTAADSLLGNLLQLRIAELKEVLALPSSERPVLPRITSLTMHSIQQPLARSTTNNPAVTQGFILGRTRFTRLPARLPSKIACRKRRNTM